jgi:hypothetical protein
MAATHLHTSKFPQHLEYMFWGASALERIRVGDTDIGRSVECVAALVRNPTYSQILDCIMRHYTIARDCLRAVWLAVESVARSLEHMRKLDERGISDALDGVDVYQPIFAIQRAYDVPGFSGAVS